MGIDKLVLEIMGKVLQITHNTETDMFISYEGHTDELDIRVCWGGYQGKGFDFSKTIYLDFEEAPKELEKFNEELATIMTWEV